MDLLRLPKIPKLTLAMVTVATGCNNDITDKPLDKAIASLTKDGCKQYQQCYPRYFKENFDSIDECVSYYADDIAYYENLFKEFKKDCRNATLRLSECLANVPCEDIGKLAPCAKEYDSVQEHCDSFYNYDAGSGYAEGFSYYYNKPRLGKPIRAIKIPEVIRDIKNSNLDHIAQ